jgi:lysophospholipase L1-like esterase
MGLRGADVSPAKHHAMYRIVMLGDSFTGGRGVDDDQTFSAILERSLNANAAAGADRAVEVVNAGVDSYSPMLSYLQLSRQLPPLDPDLVVLNFDMSDLVQESLYRSRASYTAAGEPLGVDGRVRSDGPLTTRVRRLIRRHFYFTRRIVIGLEPPITGPDTLEYRVSRADRELLQHTLASDTVDRTDQWKGVFDSILRIRAYCDEIGSDFLLTVYPWGHQVSEDEWATGRDSFLPEDFTLSDNSVQTLEEFIVEHDVEFLNTFRAFRAYRGVQRLYYDLDMHWTPAGHRLMARELERRIRARFLSGFDASEPD